MVDPIGPVHPPFAQRGKHREVAFCVGRSIPNRARRSGEAEIEELRRVVVIVCGLGRAAGFLERDERDVFNVGFARGRRRDMRAARILGRFAE